MEPVYQTIFRFELRTYRWFQIYEEEADNLESLDNKPLKAGLGFKYVGSTSKQMREYQVNCHDKLENSIAIDNREFGEKLSLHFSTGQGPY